MKNIFLDCGTHLCEGLIQFYNSNIINDTFEIHTFEANPACSIKERISQIPLDIKYYEAAVWTEDGEIEFSQENHNKSKSCSPTDGYSEIDGWGSSIKELNSKWAHDSRENTIKVKSIDFSNFVNQFNKKSNIICKMDIEGSEFPVLRKMLKDNTIDRINTLYIEWHEKWLPNENVDSKNELLNKLEKRNIKIINWH